MRTFRDIFIPDFGIPFSDQINPMNSLGNFMLSCDRRYIGGGGLRAATDRSCFERKQKP